MTYASYPYGLGRPVNPTLQGGLFFVDLLFISFYNIDMKTPTPAQIVQACLDVITAIAVALLAIFK